MSQNQNNHQNIASKLTQRAHDSISQDLSTGAIQMAQSNITQLPLIKKSRVGKEQVGGEVNLLNIMRKKEKLEEELERVKQDFTKAKESLPKVMNESEEGRTKYFRSTMTSEQKQKIIKILKKSKEFEERTGRKISQLEKKIKEQNEKMRVIKQRQEAQKHMRKKKEAEEKLKMIESRKTSRQRQINSANKQFQRVANLKFLHQQIQEKWRIIEKAEEEDTKKLFEKLRQQKKFKLHEIKEHSRRYSEMLTTFAEKRQSAQKKFKEDLLQKSRLSKHAHSTFFHLINEEERQKKEEELIKIKHSQLLQNKKAVYAETVRQKHKNSQVEHKSPPKQEKTRIDIRTSKSLDNLSLHKLGNDYMKKIHSYIGQTQGLQNKNSEKQKREEVMKYNDYLTQARLERRKKEPQNVPMELKQLRKILKKESENSDSKLFKAKKLLNRMDEKAEERSSSKNLINSIYAKLSLIEEFANKTNHT